MHFNAPVLPRSLSGRSGAFLLVHTDFQKKGVKSCRGCPYTVGTIVNGCLTVFYDVCAVLGVILTAWYSVDGPSIPIFTTTNLTQSRALSITFTARHLKRHVIRGFPIMPNLFRHSKEHLWVTAKHSGYGPYSSLRLKSSCGPARALKYRIPGVHKAGTPCEIISIS